MPGLIPMLESHAPGLGWLVGIFEGWSRHEPPVTRPWIFTCLPGKAVVCGEPAGTGWWVVVAPRPEDGVELCRGVPGLIRARQLRGEVDRVGEVLREVPELAERECSRREVVCLRRARQPGDDVTVPGFRPAQVRDVRCLMGFDLVPPGADLVHAEGVLRTRILRGEVFVVSDTDRVMAMAELLPAGRYRDIQRVATLPEFRRQGYGRRLMQGLIKVASTSGKDTSLCVEPFNGGALALYGGLGFEAWGRRIDVTFKDPAD